MWGALATAERTGYTFDGWYTKADGGTEVTSSTVCSGNLTVYAHWTAVSYSISYTLNGGSVSGNPTSYTIESSAITLKNPTRSGYTFTGWTGSNGSTAQTSVTIAKGSTGNKSYTANWKKKADTTTTCKMTYKANGGRVLTAYKYGTKGSAWGTLATAYRDSYTFDGWYTSADGGTEVTSSTICNGDITVYAHWTADSYSISYNLNGGTVSGNPTSYTVETDSFTLNNPTKTGYTFTGWTGSNGDTPQTTVTVAKGSSGDKTYTAHWTINTYTVHFDGNGADSGSMSDETFTYGTAQRLTHNSFTRSGYEFLGWSTDASATTATYTNLQSVNNLAESGTVTLYAVWNKLPVVDTEKANFRDFCNWMIENRDTYGLTDEQVLDAENAVKLLTGDAGSIVSEDGCVYPFALGYSTTEEWKPQYETELADTHIGNTDDATYLDNVIAAVERIQLGNTYRAKEDLYPLNVSSGLMAMEELNINWNEAIGQMKHSALFSMTENLSGKTANPYLGWYSTEKRYYDKYGENDEYEVGHYLALTSTTKTITGYAINSYEGQAFSEDGLYYVGEGIEPSLYLQMLNDYKNSITIG